MLFRSLARVVGAALFYLLARKVAPARYAVMAPVSFLLFDPAPVPWQTHPSWYAAPSATAAALATLQFLESRRLKWLSVAAAMAALSFAFKQNIGLLVLLASGTFVLLAGVTTQPPRRLLALAQRLDKAIPGSLFWFVRLGSALLLPLDRKSTRLNSSH